MALNKIRKSKKWFAALSVTSLVIVLIFLNRASLQNILSDFKDDGTMEANFQKNETDFHLLIRMAESDPKVVRIAPDYTWLDDDASYPRPASKQGLSDERWNEYRELFGKLGLKDGLMRYPESGLVQLTAASQGLATGGKAKGYAYSTKELSPQYASLDNLDLGYVKGHTAYKKIRDNWYLFLDWE